MVPFREADFDLWGEGSCLRRNPGEVALGDSPGGNWGEPMGVCLGASSKVSQDFPHGEPGWYSRGTIRWIFRQKIGEDLGYPGVTMSAIGFKMDIKNKKRGSIQGVSREHSASH